MFNKKNPNHFTYSITLSVLCIVLKLLKSMLEDFNSLVECNVLTIVSSMYIDFLVSLLINTGIRYEANAE